jgi:hypothetical protein
MYLNFTSGIQKIYYFSCAVLDRRGMEKNIYNCTYSWFINVFYILKWLEKKGVLRLQVNFHHQILAPHEQYLL